MKDFLVQIPGIKQAYHSKAESESDAITDALFFHGLNFAPPGTRCTLFDPRLHR